MLYRSRRIHHRFEKKVKRYDTKDRNPFVNYMRERGFATPKEVWLHNFRVFLDVRLGYNRERWEAELMEKTYPSDAKWFIHHMNDFFLCFCRPEDPRDDFLLTQECLWCI